MTEAYETFTRTFLQPWFDKVSPELEGGLRRIFNLEDDGFVFRPRDQFEPNAAGIMASELRSYAGMIVTLYPRELEDISTNVNAGPTFPTYLWRRFAFAPASNMFSKHQLQTASLTGIEVQRTLVPVLEASLYAVPEALLVTNIFRDIAILMVLAEAADTMKSRKGLEHLTHLVEIMTRWGIVPYYEWRVQNAGAPTIFTVIAA